MIGKMYRPLRILNIPDKRGFTIYNKYKSNFGGTYKFEQDICLNYNTSSETETIEVDFKTLEIPVVINNAPNAEVIEGDKVITDKNPVTIKTLRKVNRPTKIASSDSLDMIIPILSQKNEEENDYLDIKMYPVIVNEEEVMVVEVSSKTPVVISAKMGVTLSK